MAQGLTEQYNSAERAPAQFPTLLIAANSERHARIQEAAFETRSVMLLRSPAGYPQARELTTVMNHAEPELVLLDLMDPSKAEICSECLRERFPKTAVIGIGARNMGERSWIAPFPPAPDQLARLIHSSIHACRGARQPALLSFVPAKAGSGASTIALHTAGAIAAEGKRVLLIDADLHSGALGTMVQTSTGFSIQQVLRGVSALDHFRLEQAVCQSNGFDLLFSDGTPVSPLPGWEDYFRILDLALARYDAIVVDLPEVVNAATQEFVQRARNVYLVSTQELVPLKLASRRLEELTAFGAAPDSVRLVINRWQRGEADAKLIEQAVGRPVDHKFQNDYHAIRKGLNTGALVPADSGLGREFREFACKALGLECKKGFGSTLGGLLGFGRSSDPVKQTAG